MQRQEGKAELIKTSAPLLAQIQAPALAYLLRQQLSQMVGIDEHNLANLLGQDAPKRHVQQKRHQLPQQTFRQPEMSTLVQKQIRALLINPQWAVYTELPEYLDLSGDFACLAALAERIQASITPLNSGAVLELMRHSDYEHSIRHIFRQAMRSPEEYQHSDAEACEDFKQGMQRLRDELKSRQINALKHKLQQGELSASEKQLLLTLLSTPKPLPQASG